MIEPLRYLKENLATHELERPVFCTNCLGSRQTRNNPNLATVFCQQCTITIDDVQEDGACLCKPCNESLHRHNLNLDHVRQIIVVGPSVRKKVVIRGDGVNFPLPLDSVVVNMKARVYHNGHRVHTEKKQTLSFMAGMSGKCVHVQVLGAQDLKGRDLTGSSDPFVVYSYCGKPVASTRVRPRNRNPRWNNETFIVPIDESMPYPRHMLPSQKDLIKFEVFDHDWITQNDFLGHIEISRSKLMKMAVISNEQPIRLNLSSKGFHGILSVQFACDKRYFYVRILSAEDLDKQDLFKFASPYCKVFIGEKNLLGSTPVISNTIHPVWTSGQEFRIRIGELLENEALLDTQMRLHRASAGMGTNRRERRILSPISDGFQEHSTLPEFLALVRVEVFDRRPWRGDHLLGKACVYSDQLRQVLPDLPTQNEYLLAQQQEPAAPPLRRLLSGSFPSPLKDSFKGLRPPSFRSSNIQQNDINASTPPAASPEKRSNKSSSSEEEEEEEEEEDSDEEDEEAGGEGRKKEAMRTGKGPGHWPVPADRPSAWADNSYDHDRDKDKPASRTYSPTALLSSLSGLFQWRPSPASRAATPATARGQENGSPSRPLSAVNSSTHTPTPITARGLALSVLGTRPATSGSTDERVWSAVQRLHLLRFSMKSYVTNFGLGGAVKDQGSLIIRLIISNRGKVAVGLDEGVRRMTIGETALIKCRYDAFYGNYTFAPSLPPRSNVVLQVRLVEVNGHGRLGMPSRIVRRLYRLLWGMLILVIRMWWSWCHKPVQKAGEEGKASDKRRKMSRRWTRFSFLSLNLQPQADDDSDYSDDFGEDDDEESDDFGEDDGEENRGDEDREEAGRREGASSVAMQIALAHPTVRKHLTKAVVTGSKLVFDLEKTAAHARAAAPPKNYAVDDLTAQLQRLQTLQQEIHTEKEKHAGRSSSREERGQESYIAVEGVEDGEERRGEEEEEEEDEEDRLEGGAEAVDSRPSWRMKLADGKGREERKADQRVDEEEDDEDEEEDEEDEEE